MKFFFLICLIFLFFTCGTPPKKDSQIQDEITEVKEVKEPINVTPLLPEGAVTANFNGDSLFFYSYVKKNNTKNGITYISFEDELFPEIQIPKSYGATLSFLKFKGYDRDLLLATVKLKDTSFNKYYVYILRNNQWKPFVNGFAIHKSNLTDSLVPIQLDSLDNTKVRRFYSVFDLDNSNNKKYSWRLLEESIPIESN